MTSASDSKISEELINSYNKKTFELAQILDEGNYAIPFDGLKDGHFLRALSINRNKLASYSIHLLDQEPFDEN